MNLGNRVTLDSISESIEYGVTASAVLKPEGPKFLRITDIQDDRVDWSSVPWCQCDERSLLASKLEPGDIVFARTGATTGKSFLIRECPSDAVFASYLIRVRVRKGIDPSYVSHFFKSNDYWAQITKSARGAAQPGVNATTLKSLTLPLPPVAEQRRIAAILDQADALRAKRREALAQLDRLAQSIFVEMFGDPISNPKGFTIRELAEVATRIQIGPFGTQLHQEDYIVGGIPLINPTHIKNGIINPDDSLTVSEKKYRELTDYHLVGGDLIVGRRGEMGRCAVITKKEHGWLCGTGSLFIRPDLKQIDPAYLSFTFSAPSMKKHLENAAQGVTMPNLNKAIISGLKIPMPPLQLQRNFFQTLSNVATARKFQVAHLANFEMLFSSLQCSAFQGEL